MSRFIASNKNINEGLKSRENLKSSFSLMSIFIKKNINTIPKNIEIKIVVFQISKLNSSILDRGPNPILTGPSYPTPPSRQFIEFLDNSKLYENCLSKLHLN